MAGKDIRAYFNFDTEEGEDLLIKFALSNTSTQGALKNLKAEVPHWDFDQVRIEPRAGTDGRQTHHGNGVFDDFTID